MPSDNCARSDDAAVFDDSPRKDDGAGADPDAIADRHRRIRWHPRPGSPRGRPDVVSGRKDHGSWPDGHSLAYDNRGLTIKYDPTIDVRTVPYCQVRITKVDACLNADVPHVHPGEGENPPPSID